MRDLFEDPSQRDRLSKMQPLDWWRRESDEFKNLHDLAKMMLCIQAASTASEREFSIGGRLMTRLRSRLTEDNVADTVIIVDFVRHLQEGSIPMSDGLLDVAKLAERLLAKRAADKAKRVEAAAAFVVDADEASVSDALLKGIEDSAESSF